MTLSTSLGTDQHVVIPLVTDCDLGQYQFEVLRYPSIASANAIYMDKTVIYVRPHDIEERMTMSQMHAVAKRLLVEQFDESDLPRSKPMRALWLWKICLKYAKPHNPYAKTKGKRADNRTLNRYRVSPLYNENPSISQQQLTPQIRSMMNYFERFMSPDGVDEEGVELLVRNMHEEGYLTTKQDPVRIWRYYREDMLGMCLLEKVE